MKKTFYELYLEKKNLDTTPEVSNNQFQDMPRIRSPSYFLLRLKFYSIQVLKLIIGIMILIFATVGAFSLTNPYIRHEIIWLLFN